MAHRRGHGEGSIYRRQDGRWTASIVLEDGKRKYLYGKTQKEVQEKLRTAIQEQKRGILATGPRQTVKVYLEYWLEEVHKPTIRLNSYKIYRNMLDRHVLPELGEVQLQRLTPQHIQTLYNKESKTGFSPKSIRTMHAMLQAAFSHAIKLKLISYSPCEAVSLPRLEKHEMQVLSKEQARKLLEVAKGHRLEVMLMVAIVTGMRRGELLALRWQDIDFDKQLLHIRRTVNFIPHHGYVEGEPKTSTSKRVIVLPSFVIKSLEEHRVRQSEIREQAGKSWEEHDLVFSNNFGRYFNTMILYQKFSALLEEAGLPHLRFHDLRHSAATILLEMGVQLNVIQELLGHSRITMTLGTYSHVLPSMRQGMIDDLENFFS